MVRLLLAANAAVNVAKWSGKGPLWSACWKGHIDTVRLLLHEGACPDEKDDEGWTALHAASSYGHIEVVRDRNIVNT